MRKIVVILTCIVPFLSYGQIFYAGKQPGKAVVKNHKGNFFLKNNVLQTGFSFAKNKFISINFENAVTKQIFHFDSTKFFSLVLNTGTIVNGNDFVIKTISSVKDIAANPNAVKLSEKDAGKKLNILFYNEKYKISLQWSAVLRDNSNYIQQFFSFKGKDPSVKIDKLYLINLPSSEKPEKSGIVDGLPLIVKQNFFAIENPMSKIDSTKEYIYRTAVLSNDDSSFHVSIVFGVTPESQLRRGFQYYLERERAMPYTQFLHYNSWFDLSWDTLRLREADCLDRIKIWSDSLTIKRGVKLDGYLWDDGWDDYNTLWQFNKGLPNGFKNLYALSSKYGAAMGVWISPWGGYGEPKQKRLAFGKNHIPPYEINAHGFSLSGKNYFNYFKSLATNFIQQQHVAIFKFDGIGSGTHTTGAGLQYQSDIQSLLRFISSLREVKPDIYLSLTVGTWASPYLLLCGNNIWRGGGDYGFTGIGNKRQRWLNYRDHDIYEEVVSRSKLFPLNAVMNHGIMIADHGEAAPANIDDTDVSDDIWAFFGCGTSLQEMYINPHKLDTYEWNVLAKAIKWSKEHKDVLADVHWVGGAPAKQEVYGFASWNPKHGTLTLRNPSDKNQTFSFTLKDILELPANFNGKYKLFNVVNDKEEGIFESDKTTTITLKPFEVKVMNVDLD
ncbi:hypothetical protein A9P82_09210 [Arachidicoccus ginsenosidimutans]|nr:hypothetical protein A9P82_09210 [Arachidicoccus sp. BS20]